jgi:kynureninase
MYQIVFYADHRPDHSRRLPAMPFTEATETTNASDLDAADPLADFRDRFHIPKTRSGANAIYLTGNSLGLQPKSVGRYVEQELEDWRTLGVEGHLNARNPWLPYHELLTEQMAEIVGARPVETVVMNSLTVNLHLLMVSFYRPTATRTKVVIEKGAFPSDRYAVLSQIRFHGFEPENCLIELAPRNGESTLRTADIIRTLETEGDSVALVLIGGVNYYTGHAFDMRSITKAGHRVGSVVGFDLAHAAGNIELQLHDWDVDFAAWCSYKYLNGGPGSVGGAFVHERHARAFDLPRFAGWWGHDKESRLLMGPDFDPIAGAEGWQISNPPILQMAALKASLEIFAEAKMPRLVAKSKALTGYLEFLLRQIDDDRIEVITPSDPGDRGCQLSIRVDKADKTLFNAITDAGVIADWREPDVIRVAPVPLYNSFTDVSQFVQILKTCLK